MRFWNRKAFVKISRDVPLLPIKISSPIRIQFRVVKNSLLKPNTAQITISNLSKPTQHQLEKFGADIELAAGYEDDLPNLPILFRGQARTIDHRKKKSEWQTLIQCGDGEHAFRYGQFSDSWSEGTPTTKIAGDIAGKLSGFGIDISSFLKQLQGGMIQPSKSQFASGYMSQGSPLQELEKLLAPDGYSVSIQNGELQVVAVNGTSPRTALLISQETGLIGSPGFGTPDHNGLPSILKIHTFLLPKLNPQDGFILKSRGIHGFYRVQKLIHHGDTHTHQWTTEIDTRPISSSIQQQITEIDPLLEND